MKFMTASEANLQFSSILSMVSGGEEIVVTSHGKPVARIVSLEDGEIRRAAIRAKLFNQLKSQPTLGIPVDWTKDDLYEADF